MCPKSATRNAHVAYSPRSRVRRQCVRRVTHISFRPQNFETSAKSETREGFLSMGQKNSKTYQRSCRKCIRKNPTQFRYCQLGEVAASEPRSTSSVQKRTSANGTFRIHTSWKSNECVCNLHPFSYLRFRSAITSSINNSVGISMKLTWNST